MSKLDWVPDLNRMGVWHAPANHAGLAGPFCPSAESQHGYETLQPCRTIRSPESKDGLHTINVNQADGIAHALLAIRKKFDFEKWRVINVAEHLEPLP